MEGGQPAEIGDRSRNAGVVILVVPKETSSDGRGYCRIETGQGAEGFITDATSGEICREATPVFQQRDYGRAIGAGHAARGERYATEFGFALDTSFRAPRRCGRRRAARNNGADQPRLPAHRVLHRAVPARRAARRRGCGGCMPIFLPIGGFGGGGRSSWGGGGGFGGGGGGGFGGFGGGGGFSGGGGGSSLVGTTWRR